MEIKRSRFTEGQIIGVLKEHKPGAPRESCAGGTGSRRQPSATGVAAMAGWRSRKPWLKGLEDENRRLKKLLAESMLNVATLREALAA